MHVNARWSTSYKNRLPDSAFFYVDKSCVTSTDKQGRSHPLSCRHFPYKNHLGAVSTSHVRNAISRAPQSDLPKTVQHRVQQQARRVLNQVEGTSRMAANSLSVRIPKMHRWKQISGDMNPAQYGAIIARSEAGDTALELKEIQPVREYVGDGEAAEVGFPFWTREAWYDKEDLELDRQEVQHALQSVGLEEHELSEMTPEQRALAIAEALMRYGDKVEEGTGGWSSDVLGEDEEVEWWGGEPAGSSALADEDDEFRREILGEEEDEDEDDFEANPSSGGEGYGEVFRDTAGPLVVVVRKVFRPRKGDYYHVRVLNPQYDEFLEKRKAVLFRADETTRHDAINDAWRWLASEKGRRAQERAKQPRQSARTTPKDYWGRTDQHALDKREKTRQRREASRRARGITDTMSKNARSAATSPAYGPGKFDTNLDAAVYHSLSELEDASVGSRSAPPYTYAVLIRDGRSIGKHLTQDNVQIGARELAFLRTKGAAGAIVFENDQGFVQVVYYDTPSELEADWSEAEAKLGGISENPTQGARSKQAARAKFDNLRRRALEASAKWQDAKRELGFRYGHARGWEQWLKATEKRKLERLSAAADRERIKFLDYLDSISPRDWSYGVPSHWLVENLSFEDAVRPVGETLSVVPPLSYGSTTPRS